jgi:Predicted transcriptional regulators
MDYYIGEVAKRLNVTVPTLRYYDKEGLLPFVDRTSSGIRQFKESDFEWLFIIECLKKAGMSLKEIKTYIQWCIEGDSTIEQRLDLIKKQQAAVETQIAELQETLEVVKYKRWRYEVSKAAGTTAIHDTMKTEDIPEEFRAIHEKVHALHGI